MKSTLDYESMRQELKAFHAAFIDAHVNHKPEFMVQDLDEHFVNVSRGELVRATKEDILEQFTQYLGRTEFSGYSMPEEPEIRFSNDGSVAWSVFRLHVAATLHPSDGTDVEYEDTWACLVVFRREGDRWLRVAEASNRIPR